MNDRNVTRVFKIASVTKRAFKSKWHTEQEAKLLQLTDLSKKFHFLARIEFLEELRKSHLRANGIFDIREIFGKFDS